MKIGILVFGLCLITTFALAEEKLKYPLTCTTMQNKITFCYIAQEELRLAHNIVGKDYRDGKLTKKEWEIYITDDFMPKQELIINDMLIQKEVMKKSTQYEVDLNDLEKAITP